VDLHGEGKLTVAKVSVLPRRQYVVVFNNLKRRWQVRHGRSGWGSILSTHRTQQAAADRAKAWAIEDGGTVRCEDRQGRTQWEAKF
jgi:hypothetical protein